MLDVPSERSEQPSPRTSRKPRPVVMLAFKQPQELDPELAASLLEEAGKRDWTLLDLDLTGGVLADQQPPDGAIVTWLPTDPISQQLLQMGVPTIRMGKRSHPDDGPIPAVYPDNPEGGRVIAEYFARRGFREVACVTHENNEIMRSVADAMRDRAAELEYRFHIHLLKSLSGPIEATGLRSERLDQRIRHIDAWIKELPKPVAIAAYSDQMAAQICILCQRAGFAVPEEVAVLGRGNTPVWCELAPVPISSLDVNRRRLIRTVVELLDEMIQGNPVAARTLVPSGGIVTRRSTDILAADDPDVVRAVRFIWDHLDDDISVDDIAKAIGAPRYRIERAFRKHLSRGVKEELQRIRMERLCELLRTTTSTIAELAPQVGFRSVEYLHNAFRKTYGITPRGYRLRMKHPERHANATP